MTTLTLSPMTQVMDENRNLKAATAKQYETIVAQRAEIAQLREALETAVMFITNTNTINEDRQRRFVKQLIDAGEKDMADVVAVAGFASALETETK